MRGIRKPRTFGLKLFWLLQVEISRNQDSAIGMEGVQALLVRCLGDGDLGAQFSQQNSLWSRSGFFARVIDTYMGRRQSAILGKSEDEEGENDGDDDDDDDQSEEEKADRRALRRASTVAPSDMAAALGASSSSCC